jgi:hypothetical protein
VREKAPSPYGGLHAAALNHKHMIIHLRRVMIFAALIAPLATWSESLRDASGASVEATARTYKQERSSKGVVLLDINWGRRWNCADYENAELRMLAFDQVPLSKSSDEEPPDLILAQGPSLFSEPTFKSYALLVSPGEYALTAFDIKVARSVADISHWGAKRTELWREGKAAGGTFKVAPGETVYIGNFFLDCYKQPQPWRYYTEGEKNFSKHLHEYKHKYPFLDVANVSYRLFDTNSIGNPYELK